MIRHHHFRQQPVASWTSGRYLYCWGPRFVEVILWRQAIVIWIHHSNMFISLQHPVLIFYSESVFLRKNAYKSRTAYIDGPVQERHNPRVLAMELRPSRTNPSICPCWICHKRGLQVLSWNWIVIKATFWNLSLHFGDRYCSPKSSY